ncbi:OprO/OprP family phosphate-selective porin [Nitrosospira sp. Nsp13]|jgi:phosphate-selective porin OprO/OprP|uniref:OprO/OprP family phosphate-selective porin n=1 Tax=Nitrosospira sp. Nsp13 TaxID=1855332 RepID=UPI00087FD77E|nr:porin [Nitrosospira sp. Nsp13]SCY47346.1 phosphate-selective porin OprO and OprP [Nitrosospira sp. Nsp13]
MKLSKLAVAIAAILGAGVSFGAYAIDLYVDTKTEQIYAKPGPGRVHMGSFVRQDAQAKVPDNTASSAAAVIPVDKTDAAELTAVRRDIELKAKMMGARLTSDLASLEERVKETEKVHIEFHEGAPHFASKDGNFTFAINGRMQVGSQYNFINDVLPATGANLPNELNSGVTLRRARLGVEGTFYKIWDYKFEYDFSRGNGSVESGITDAFLRMNVTKPFSVKVGSFKEPFSLEEAASNRFLTFIERHMSVNSFVDNPNTYKTGIGANYAVPRFQFGVAFQTEPVGAWSAASTTVNAAGNNSRNNGSGDQGWEGIGRITGRPWMEDETKFLHVGISAGHTHVNTQYLANGTINVGPNQTGGGGGMAFFAFPGTNVDRTNVLNTGNLSIGNKGAPGSRRIDSYDRFGAEGWLVHGPFSAQTEYLRTNINGQGYDGEHFTGYYGFLSYFLTGESKAYHVRNGAANRIKPKQNFQWNGSGWGAWEIAGGYDYINLNSGVVRGGKMDMVRFGLNWYPHTHVKIQNNITYVLNVDTSGSPIPRTAGFNNADLSSFLTQVQVDF